MSFMIFRCIYPLQKCILCILPICIVWCGGGPNGTFIKDAISGFIGQTVNGKTTPVPIPIVQQSATKRLTVWNHNCIIHIFDVNFSRILLYNYRVCDNFTVIQRLGQAQSLVNWIGYHEQQTYCLHGRYGQSQRVSDVDVDLRPQKTSQPGNAWRETVEKAFKRQFCVKLNSTYLGNT